MPTLTDFLSGTPEEVIMSSNPDVVVTWMHTNELHAPIVAHTIYSTRPDLAQHMNYKCIDPLTAQNDPEKGFGDEDINRCFDEESVRSPKTYAQRQAASTLEFIQNAKFVVDPHNSVCKGLGKLLIVDAEYFERSRTIRRMVAASRVGRIMLMAPDVSRKCLIGEAGRRAITLEYEMDLNTEAVSDTIALIEALVTGETPHDPFEREVFRITGAIPKSEDPGLHVQNYEPYIDKNGNLRYATFLGIGPRSYREDETKDYCGYAATMEKLVI